MTLLSLGGAWAACPAYPYIVYKDTSHDADGLEPIVGLFKKAFGGEDNGNEPGPISDGVRTINWDGEALPFDMPPDAFQDTRGALFSTLGDAFAVSNPSVGEPAADDLFSTLLPFDTSKEFLTFSPPRLFTSQLDNKLEATFSIPGSKKPDPASTQGYGVVFVDVDKEYTTKMSYYDKDHCPIAEVYIPAKPSGLSFVGVVFKDPVVFKVELELGEISVDEAGKGSPRTWSYEVKDVVVTNDFIWGEPQPIEEAYDWSDHDAH